jgi:hypothetical protein
MLAATATAVHDPMHDIRSFLFAQHFSDPFLEAYGIEQGAVKKKEKHRDHNLFFRGSHLAHMRGLLHLFNFVFDTQVGRFRHFWQL